MSKFSAILATIGTVAGFGFVAYHNGRAANYGGATYTTFGYFVFMVGGFLIGAFVGFLLNVLTAIEKRSDRYMEKQNRAE